MKMKDIRSYIELKQLLERNGKSYLLLFRKGNEVNDSTYLNLREIAENYHDLLIMSADVTFVRDIHENYEIKAVPSLLEFEKRKHINTYKGYFGKDQLKNILEHALTIIKSTREGKRHMSVTVYSTPTCSWCNTLKGYLRKNRIQFTDIDVSRDEQAVSEMVRKSGQQGVPQTIINGKIIIGFDKQKLDRLLEIEAGERVL